jgi:hypothetical protein
MTAGVPVTVTLGQSAVVTLDGTGAGTARIGPVNARETWSPQTISGKTTQAPGTIVSEAQWRTYIGPGADDQYYVDSTLDGSTGDSTTNCQGQVVNCGEYVWMVWTGGDAGAQGRLNVSGSKTIASARRG